MQEQEKELFGDYEIKNWSFSPRVYKILAASAILNLLAVLVMAQTSVLTRKGCDSPFVSSICQVLDAVYVGSALLGADGEFVSKDYQKTELENADITYIDVSSDSPPLKYPEGYFALANPEQFAAAQNPTTMPPDNFGNPSFGGFSTIPPPPPSSSDLLASKPNLPPPNNNPIIGDLPSSINGAPPISYPKMPRRKFPRVVTPKPSKIPDDVPTDLLKPNDAETAGKQSDKTDKSKDENKPDANQKPIESEKVADIEINKKPFEDLGDTLNEKLAKNEVDLSKPFFVVLEGTITADGKFDPKKSKWIDSQTKGDPKMVEIAKQAIESVGYSGILGYLKNSGVDKVSFTLVQDDKQIYAIIVSEQKTPNNANSIASGFNTLLSGVKLLDENGVRALDENSKIIVNNSKVTSSGKNFVLNFAIPKPVGQDLINRSLKQRAEKKNNQPDNSGELGQSSNANTGR